ncbi:putative hydroxyacyl-coenzyme A dehydrogenase, mitochondrial [Apostichopus japonicus]|uniref:3-hydroxyacyl-CoA dehydrogenase n=1 Tax=Stichopus japonicus TaxID=307972 RepID=A0A2G8KF19_STIJA|nr:putative hydroxyacyl-coenzyme A dehydrogenase, mitochondrial [Apostichopus japonicus]
MSLTTKVFSRGLSTSAVRMAAIKNVTVIGGGLMGAGIAQVAAQTGHSVTIVDQTKDILQQSRASIEKSISRVSKKKFKDDANAGMDFVKKTIGRIKMNTNAEESVKEADLVIEAIIENLDVKRELFGRLDKAAKSVIHSRSPFLSISVPPFLRVTRHHYQSQTSPLRLREGIGLGVSIFSIRACYELVEVIRTEETSDDTYNSLMAFSEALGKTPVTCKDTPGFIVNRLLVPYLVESVRLIERGDASPRDVDIAMKLGAGYPMGPFEL